MAIRLQVLPIPAIMLTATGMFLGLPNPFLHIPFAVLLLPAGLYSMGVNAFSVQSAFRWGWLAAALGAGSVLYWLAYPIHTYGFVPWPLATVYAFLIGIWVGVFGGLFSAGCHVLRRICTPSGQLEFSCTQTIYLCVGSGALWGLLETLRGTLFSGFPWATLASAFVPLPQFLQIASVIGGVGLGALVACIACALAHLAYAGRGRYAAAIVLMALPSILYTYGAAQLATPLVGQERTVAIIQGNIDQGQKWLPEYQQGTMNRYIKMSQGAVDRYAPELLVWPETAMPFYYQKHSLGKIIRKEIQQLKTPLLLGTPGYTQNNDTNDHSIYNRAYLLDAAGRDAGYYDKKHLVPFGEYLPPLLDLPFLRTMMQAAGDFTPGTHNAPLRAEDLALGVLICYESIFAELAQQRVADGATLLVNISNDAWFGQTSAPYQHLHLTAVRAVEQGRFIVRATNTGISALIDPYGRIVQSGPLFKAAVITGNIRDITTQTTFHKIYPYLTPVLMLVLVLAVAGCLASTALKNRR